MVSQPLPDLRIPFNGDPGDVKFYEGYSLTYGESISISESFQILEVLAEGEVEDSSDRIRLYLPDNLLSHPALKKAGKIEVGISRSHQPLFTFMTGGIRCSRMLSDRIKNCSIVRRNRTSWMYEKMGLRVVT